MVGPFETVCSQRRSTRLHICPQFHVERAARGPVERPSRCARVGHHLCRRQVSKHCMDASLGVTNDPEPPMLRHSILVLAEVFFGSGRAWCEPVLDITSCTRVEYVEKEAGCSPT